MRLADQRTTKAIHKMHQATINRFVKWNLDHDMLVNENDYRDGEGLNIKQGTMDKAYNKAAELWADLPARERANLIKTHEYLKGSY